MALLPTAAAVLFTVAVAVILYRLLVKGGDAKRSLPLPPSGDGLPFIGDTFSYIKHGPRVPSIPNHAKLGNIYRSWFMGEQVIHVGDVESVRFLLNAVTDTVEGDWPSSIGQLIGAKSISNLHGEHHARVRKMILPAFSPKAGVAYVPRTVEIAQNLCAEWAEAHNIKGFYNMKAFTFQVATELILGFPADINTKELLARQQQLWGKFVAGFLSLPLNLPGFGFYQAMQARKGIIAEFSDQFRKMADPNSRVATMEPKPAMQYFLEAIAEDENAAGDMEMISDVALNMLFAGHDTTAASLTLMMRYLKQEPQVLQKVRDEQQQVIAEFGAALSSTALSNMPYADATIKETLRYEPIVGEVYRRATKTFELGGYTFPKGHKIALELFKVFEEDPRWIDAKSDLANSKFNPDRWLSEEGRRAGSWLPFGSGPRMCLGYTFAQQEMKIMLAVVARDYDWELDLEEHINSFPIPTPVRAQPMTFHRLPARRDAGLSLNGSEQ